VNFQCRAQKQYGESSTSFGERTAQLSPQNAPFQLPTSTYARSGILFAGARIIAEPPSSLVVYIQAATANNAAPPAPIISIVACGAPPVAEDAASLAAELADDSILEIALLNAETDAVDVTLASMLLTSPEMLEPAADVSED
jgi:hypothetical protein